MPWRRLRVADELDGYLDSRGARLPLDDNVYGGVYGLWLLIFCFRAAYLVSKNWFEAADRHLLPRASAPGWRRGPPAGTRVSLRNGPWPGEGSAPSSGRAIRLMTAAS